MVDVTVITPNGSVNQALEHCELSADRESVRVLGFPKHLFEFHAEVDRKMFENRETVVSMTVDLLTGTSMKSDVYPETEMRSFSRESLLNPRIERSTAEEKAHSQVRRRVNSWYKSFSAPAIDIKQDQQVFKLFWMVPASTTDTATMIDTITGEVAASDIEVNEMAQIEDRSPIV